MRGDNDDAGTPPIICYPAPLCFILIENKQEFLSIKKYFRNKINVGHSPQQIVPVR